MSTVMEIKAAIEKLSPAERVRLHTMVWPEEADAPSDRPPCVHERLTEAANGTFKAGSRDNIRRILDTL